MGYSVPIALVILALHFGGFEGKIKLKREPLPTFKNPRKEIKLASIAVSVSFLFLVLWYALIETSPRAGPAVFLMPIANHILVVIPFVALLMHGGRGINTCFLGVRPAPAYFLLGVFMGILGGAVSTLVSFNSTIGIFPSILVGNLTSGALIFLIPIFIEEFIFRGFLLSRLSILGAHKAVILSVLIFTLMHIPRFIMQLDSIPIYFLFALALGYLALYLRNFLPGVFLHWMMNLM